MPDLKAAPLSLEIMHVAWILEWLQWAPHAIQSGKSSSLAAHETFPGRTETVPHMVPAPASPGPALLVAPASSICNRGLRPAGAGKVGAACPRAGTTCGAEKLEPAEAAARSDMLGDEDMEGKAWERGHGLNLAFSLALCRPCPVCI